jgi:hypothetical protein
MQQITPIHNNMQKSERPVVTSKFGNTANVEKYHICDIIPELSSRNTESPLSARAPLHTSWQKAERHQHTCANRHIQYRPTTCLRSTTQLPAAITPMHTFCDTGCSTRLFLSRGVTPPARIKIFAQDLPKSLYLLLAAELVLPQMP